MSILQTALYFFLSLLPLVLVHELGHFAIAKLNGVGVEEFGIGFPPRAARLFRRGGTDYTLNWLPLGGFVRLTGEEDPTVPGAFAAAAKRVRTAVLAAGPAANFAFAVVVLSALWYHGMPDLIPGVTGIRVNAVDAGPARDAGLAPNDLIVSVNGTPLKDSAKHLGDVPCDLEIAPAEMKYFSCVTRNSAGKAMQLSVIRIDRMLTTQPTAGVETEPYATDWVDGQRVVSAPAGSGLTAGDIVVQADDASAVLRGVTSRQVSVTPALAPDPDNPDANIGRLGIVMDTARATVRYGPVAAARQGLRTTSEMSLTLVGALAQMIRDLSPNQLSGPVEIAKISRQQAEAGFVPFFMFMAVLSVNLGLINLLPIPALDGGRLLFIAFEALRGRRVDPAREQLVHLIGFVLVLSLMAVLTVAELAGRGP